MMTGIITDYSQEKAKYTVKLDSGEIQIAYIVEENDKEVKGRVVGFNERSTEEGNKTVLIDQVILPDSTAIHFVQMDINRSHLNGKYGKIFKYHGDGEYSVQIGDDFVIARSENIRF
jgi:hypothetical protein